MRGQYGLTLVELMIALVVAGILFGLGVPAMERMVSESRATTTANRLVGSIQYAKSESLRLGVPVSLCPSGDGLSCLASRAGWAAGWIIYRHRTAHGPNTLVDPGQILRVDSAGMEGLRANRQRFTLRTDGRRSTNGTLLICRPEAAQAHRAVIVNVMGRPRSTRDPARMPSPEC